MRRLFCRSAWESDLTCFPRTAGLRRQPLRRAVPARAGAHLRARRRRARIRLQPPDCRRLQARFQRSQRVGFARPRRGRRTGRASPHARSRRTGRSRRSRRSRSRPGRASGSGLSLTVSVGQPDSRMQEWSPVQTSSSTPYLTRTTRSPSLRASRRPGRDAALPLELALALGDDDLQALVGGGIASFSVFAIVADAVGVDRAQPFDAEAAQRGSIVMSGASCVCRAACDDGMYPACRWPRCSRSS